MRPKAAHLRGAYGICRQRLWKSARRSLVKPGERVPLDGKVVEGRSQLKPSALAGEPRLRSTEPGTTVLVGMVNGSGALTVRVSRPFTDSSIARTLDLVQNASSKKAATEKPITRFARRYTRPQWFCFRCWWPCCRC